MTDCAVLENLGFDVAVVAPLSSASEADCDCVAFLARLDGDTLLARELIELFLEDYPRTLAALEHAVRTGNAPALRLAAHALRGTVAIFCAASSVEIAHRLEQMGRTGALTGAPDLYATLVEAVARLRSALVGLSARLSC